jgi:hypothetical protein
MTKEKWEKKPGVIFPEAFDLEKAGMMFALF